jgi:cytochrome c biogenesis factor
MPAVFVQFFNSITATLPMLLVYAVGLVVALTYRQRAPRASLLTITGCISLLVLTAIGPLIQQQMIRVMRSSPSSLGLSLMAVSLALNILRAIATSVILVAVFIDRPQFAEPEGFEPLPPPLPPRH